MLYSFLPQISDSVYLLRDFSFLALGQCLNTGAVDKYFSKTIHRVTLLLSYDCKVETHLSKRPGIFWGKGGKGIIEDTCHSSGASPGLTLYTKVCERC